MGKPTNGACKTRVRFPTPPRMRYTKKMVNEQLKHSWTPKGVKMWWDRPRYQLGGLTPLEAWNSSMQKYVYDLAESDNEMEMT